MTISDDLAAIYADESLSVPVSTGSLTTRGFLSWQDATRTDSSGELALISERTLTIATDALGTLATGGTLTVDGTDYTIHEIRRINDGLETEVVLA